MRKVGVVATVVAAALMVIVQEAATAAPADDQEKQFIVPLREASGVRALTSARPVVEWYGGTVLRTYVRVLNGLLGDAYTDEAGAGVKTYIMDTGIRTSHTEFDGRATIGFDAINDGWNGQDYGDLGHGTPARAHAGVPCRRA